MTTRGALSGGCYPRSPESPSLSLIDSPLHTHDGAELRRIDFPSKSHQLLSRTQFLRTFTINLFQHTASRLCRRSLSIGPLQNLLHIFPISPTTSPSSERPKDPPIPARFYRALLHARQTHLLPRPSADPETRPPPNHDRSAAFPDIP